MILQIKKIDDSADGGRAPPKVGPRDILDWEEWNRMWGGDGYIKQLYNITLTGDQLERSVVWPVLSRYLDTDNILAYTTTKDTDMDTEWDWEHWNSVREAFERGRFNTVVTREEELGQFEPYLANYSGCIIVRASKPFPLMQWYDEVIAVSLGNNISYVLLRDRRRRPRTITVDDFPRCSWRDTCEHVFAHLEKNLIDGKLVPAIDSPLVEL